MPPLLFIVAKAAPAHRGGEQRAVGMLLGADARVGGPRFRAEKVEMGAHVELGAVGARQRQVHGRAARMAGTRGDIAVAKQRALVDIGIKFGFRRLIAQVTRPAHEILNRADRPVAVEHFDEETRGEVARDFGERGGGRAREQAMRRLIAVDRPADEIVRTGIAHLDDQSRHHRRGIDERSGAILGGGLSGQDRQHCRDERIANSYCGHADTHWPSIEFCESTMIMPAISALVRTVPE